METSMALYFAADQLPAIVSDELSAPLMRMWQVQGVT